MAKQDELTRDISVSSQMDGSTTPSRTTRPTRLRKVRIGTAQVQRQDSHQGTLQSAKRNQHSAFTKMHTYTHYSRTGSQRASRTKYRSS